MNDLQNFIDSYLKTKHQSLVRIISQPDYSERRLSPNIPQVTDSTAVVLVNFIIKDRELYPDYDHPVIGSVRQMAVFLRSPKSLTKDTPDEMLRKVDNCRKDIRTIANKNAFWVNLDKLPFNGLADYEGHAWLVLFKEDFDKIQK